ncbi:hypothetical protein [Duodenibacillus massiliensis]|uniref:hypothetical protein n=1 Tax=Duodenibacillus massiliensis TaxID=1852381 RepID=UPI003076D42D
MNRTAPGATAQNRTPRKSALNAENRPHTRRFFEVSALYKGIAALYRKILKKATPVVQIHNRHDKLLKAFLFEGFFTSFVAN